MIITEKEKKMLWELQSNFPIVIQPYKEIGERVGFSEQEIIDKISDFKKNGVIRYVGAVYNSKKIGYFSTLIAAKVPENKLNKTVSIINEYLNVTHNYLREDKYNLWFTLIAESDSRIVEIIEEIKERTGIKEILNLKTKKLFKIDARFKLSPIGK